MCTLITPTDGIWYTTIKKIVQGVPAMRETATFLGVTYYRYPEAKNTSDRRYFKNQGRVLHREIWAHHNGPIPEGHEIHHRDHNTGNNAIENLEIVSRGWHRKHHANLRPKDELLAFAERGRPLTKAWHASPEGRKWHSKHGVESFKKRAPIELQCKQCNSIYATRKYGGVQFCSGKCKSAWRRESGVDNVTKICSYCGNEFTANRYARAIHCSNQCAARNRRASRLADTRRVGQVL